MSSTLLTKPVAIYTYSIAHLTHCEKIKFYYTLKGRDKKKGILDTTDSEQLGKGVLLVPQTSWSAMADFLADWRCPFKRRVVFEVEP